MKYRMDCNADSQFSCLAGEVGDRIVDTTTLSDRRSSHARSARYRRMQSLVRASAFCLAYPTSYPQNHSRTGEKSPYRKLGFGVLRGFSQLWDASRGIRAHLQDPRESGRGILRDMGLPIPRLVGTETKPRLGFE